MAAKNTAGKAGKAGTVVDTVRETVHVPERPTLAVGEAVAPCDTFSWMDIAKAELGQREVKGAKHNPRIIEYHKTTTLKGTTDEIPWCSSFVNWVMKQAGYPGTNSAAARSWLQYGQRLATPVPGCIVVLSRDGGGHVGFYMGQDSYGIKILGGNQGDAVTVAQYAHGRCLALVVPRNMRAEDNELFYRELARCA
jgi:uncharacterized protein (TIGR02594 family)